MTVTTTLTPPVGINWQAVITAYLSLLVEPSIGAKNTVESWREAGLTITPRIGQRPPEQVILFASPSVGDSGGSKVNASGGLVLTPAIGISTNPSATVNVAVSPSIGAVGRPVEYGSVNLTVTPSIGLGGAYVAPHPTYDASGAGYLGTSTSPSWSHDIGSAAKALVVFISAYTNSGSPVPSSVKVGGTSLTELGSLGTYGSSVWNAGGGFYLYLYAYGLIDPPTGPQTIAISYAGGTGWQTAASSVSYETVSSFGTVTTAGPTAGTSASQSVSSATGDRIAQAFTCGGESSGSFSSYSETSRYSAAFGSSVNPALVIGDAAGATTVPFTATAPTGAASWGGIAVPLIP